MNARQAAKAAAKRIGELEWINGLNRLDIRDYNKCIQHMINHGSPCDWCEDLAECREEGKDVTIGCDQWMLRSQDIHQLDEGSDADESKGVLPASPTGGE